MGIIFSVKNRIYVFLVFSLVLCFSHAYAQDPEFSQFYASPIYTNPAFAGSSTVGRIVTNARSQWPNIAGSLRTISASYDEHFDVINGGIGIMAVADEAGSGLLQSISLKGIYSYQIIITRQLTMRAAIEGSINQKSINFSKLTWSDMIAYQQGFIYPTQEPQTTPNVFYPNFDAGFVLYSNKFYAGFAAHNITQPNQAFYDQKGNNPNANDIIPIRYTAHAGLVIPIEQGNPKSESNLWPNILYMKQRQYDQLNLGLYYNKGPFVVGAYYRQTTNNSDCMIILLGIRKDKLRFGYSYDRTLSNANPGAPDSHEISLAFELRKHTPKKTIRAIKCPEF